MRIKQMTSWTLRDLMPSCGIFFGVYILLILLVTVVTGMELDGTGESSSNLSMGSGMGYLLVVGIIIFSMYLKVGLANGVSRRSIFVSFGICAAVFAAITAVGELLLAIPMQLIAGIDFRAFVHLSGFYEGGTWMYWAGSLLLTFCGNFMLMMLGLFIGGGYYRMGRKTRLLVSILVPVILLVGGPLVWLQLLTEGARQAIAEGIFVPIVQFFTNSAVNQMLFYLAVAAIFVLLVWLLLRKAPIRQAR